LLAITVGAVGCTTLVQSAGIALLYREADHPAESSRLDVPYVEGASPTGKQSLDLYWPEPGTEPGWPSVVFVHGGGWTFGDRGQSVAGADIYRNIGRFLASHGIGAAIISYRLQPDADWHAQLQDVARALAFVRGEVVELGGRRDALFLAGHSAGSWLAARVGLDPGLSGPDEGGVCGLVLVSGTAYDLDDDETWALGANRAWFEERFDDGEPHWIQRASVVPLVEAASPPALIVYASGEPAKLRRQSDVLLSVYDRAGAPAARVIVPGEDHERIVLTLSRDDKTSGPAILRFVESQPCGPDRSAATSAAGG
jgi:acetyl esterase/lipase